MRIILLFIVASLQAQRIATEPVHVKKVGPIVHKLTSPDRKRPPTRVFCFVAGERYPSERTVSGWTHARERIRFTVPPPGECALTAPAACAAWSGAILPRKRYTKFVVWCLVWDVCHAPGSTFGERNPDPFHPLARYDPGARGSFSC